MITIEVVKQDVEDNLHYMAKALGLKVIPFEVSPFPVQIHNVFSAAYVQDYYPEEKLVLLSAYKLLQERGCYYTVDKEEK